MTATATSAWGLPHQTRACGVCGAAWLVPSDTASAPCPCGSGELQPASVAVWGAGPEQQVAPAVDRKRLAASLSSHINKTPFKPKELSPSTMAESATLVWWPRWLLDTTVSGSWTAEVGFVETVQSNVDQLEGGRWVSRQQSQRRTRWEPRAGRVDRRLHNVVVPALADGHSYDALHRGVTRAPEPFEPKSVTHSWLRLPDLAPDAVRGEADPGVRTSLASQIERATLAADVRDLQMELNTDDETWTLRMHPMWVASYQVGGQRFSLLVDAVSGTADGPVFASMPAAYRWAIALAAGGLLTVMAAILVGILGLLFPPAIVVSALLALAGFVVTAAAIWPIVTAWSWNARQPSHANNRTPA